MPDTPIDLSEGIQSVRLKVPTAAVPIPPEGFAQLHSPAPGELALRLPDGSVAAIGGGGGGGLVDGELQFNGHSIIFHDVEGRHELTLYPEPGSNIKLAGPVTNQANAPFLPVFLNKTVVTAEQVAAAATTPVEVVQAEPSAVLVPVAFAAVYHYEAPLLIGAADYRFVWGDLDPDEHPLTDQPLLGPPMFGVEADTVWFSVAQPYGAPLTLASVVGQPVKMVGSADLDSLAGTLDVYTWVRAVVV